MARLTRGAKKAVTDEYVEQGSDDAHAEEDDFEPPKPKPKAKKDATAAAKGKGKGRKSKLQLFTSMPLDILCDICCQLDPATLLAMNKTSHVLREVLTGPSSSAIWAAAFRSVELPMLTATDLTPWAAASLIYERTCHICQKSRPITVDYTLRGRACAHCMRASSVQATKLGWHHPEALNCVPHSLWMEYTFYWAPTVYHVSKILSNLGVKQKKDSSDVYDEYIKRAKKNAKAAMTDGAALKRWELGESQRKEKSNENERRSRRKKIEAKMTELGYGPDDFRCYSWSSSKYVDQPKDLTDRIWNTIKSHCIALLDAERVAAAQRLAEHQALQRQPLLKPFYESLRLASPPDLVPVFPPFSEFVKLPAATALWKPEPAADGTNPFDPAVLFPLHSTAIFTEIRVQANKLENQIYASLAKSYAEAKDAPAAGSSTTYADAALHSGADMATLASRVTSSIRCSYYRCGALKPYPAILEHLYSHVFWSTQELSTTANQIRAIRVVLKKMELSEDTTSTEELDAMGKRFACDPCPGKAVAAVEAGGVVVAPKRMTWGEIVKHSVDGHLDRYSALPIYTPPSIVILPLEEPEVKRDAPNPQAESTGTNETHDDGMASEGTPGADATEAGAVEIESSAGESEERASGIEEPVKTEGQMDEAALALPMSFSTAETELEPKEAAHPLAQLSPARKSFLLLIFSISSFVDVCNVGGFAVAVVQIGNDIALGPSQLVWTITAYSFTFAVFLLFAGRLSDLFPAEIVFEAGFFLLGIFTLVTSFVTHSKYGFLILRGIGGVCGAMTVPSAYHLVVHMYPKHEEQQGKLALLGLSSAIGSVLGVVIAGLCMLADYRWFLRVLAIICILLSICSYILLPSTPSSYSSESNPVPRWKRMDVVGVLLMTGALVCFILSLTQGPIDGWGSASFIAPFIIAFILGPLFFVWEARISASSAVLPVSVWQITNMLVSSLAVIYAFSFWTTSQLQYSTYWQEVLGWKPIHVAAGLLPQGVVGFIGGGLAQAFPSIINKPRITIPVGAALMKIAEVLQVYSKGGGGMNYWKFCFSAFVLGSGGSVISYFASSINLIQNCPPEMAGVAGAWTQVLAQIGSAVCLAVQAGLQGPTESDWKTSDARGYWFLFALIFVLALQYTIFYKQPAPAQEEHELARMRMKAAGLAGGR